MAQSDTKANILANRSSPSQGVSSETCGGFKEIFLIAPGGSVGRRSIEAAFC